MTFWKKKKKTMEIVKKKKISDYQGLGGEGIN